MGRARKKPLEVEFFKWEGQGPSEWPVRFRDHLHLRYEISCVWVDTFEGTMRVNRGDYIICGVDGELYSCKPQVFLQVYEILEDDSSRVD